MDVNIVDRCGVAVVHLNGKLAAGAGDKQLHKLIDELELRASATMRVEG